MNAKIGQTATAFFIKEGRPGRTKMPIIRMSTGNFSQLAFLDGFRHECKLGAVHYGWRSPDSQILSFRKIKKSLAFLISISHWLFTPHMLSCEQCLFVQASMLLHIR